MSEDLESLGERIAEQAAHLDAALHRLLTDLRAFDRGGGWHAQGAQSCAHWLSWRVGWGLGAAREHVRVADRLADLPLLDAALRCGEISYAKLRAITRVATPANEAALLELARHSSGQQLETICRKYRAVLRHDAEADPEADRARRWVARRDTADGMVRIEAVLHPEEAALVWAALDHRAQQQCRESQRDSAETSSASAGAPAAAPAASAGAQATASAAPAPAAASAAAATAATAAAPPAAPTAASAVTAASAALPAAAAAASLAALAAAPTAASAVAAASLAASAASPAASAASPAASAASPAAATAAAARRRAPFDRADALVQLAQGYLRGDRPDRAPIELVVSVPAENLRRRGPDPCGDPYDGPSDDPSNDPCDVACLADGTCVSAETARRLSCDCGVVEVVEDAHGAPLSIGRKRRTISGSMKRALLQRDRTCRFPRLHEPPLPRGAPHRALGRRR